MSACEVHIRLWHFCGGCLLQFLLLGHIWAQGTIQWTVTFDGAPQLGPSDEIAIKYYSEQGMVFTPVGDGQFGRSGGQPALSGFPRNGTAYLYAQLNYSLTASSMTGVRFGLVSVDLAEFSTFYEFPAVVEFVGYRFDGGIVTTEFNTDGVIDGAGPLNDFETFYFDSRFADLVRVEIPTHTWSLDNMVFSNVIPEPSVPAMFCCGGVLLLAGRFRRCRRP